MRAIWLSLLLLSGCSRVANSFLNPEGQEPTLDFTVTRTAPGQVKFDWLQGQTLSWTVGGNGDYDALWGYYILAGEGSAYHDLKLVALAYNPLAVAARDEFRLQDDKLVGAARADLSTLVTAPGSMGLSWILTLPSNLKYFRIVRIEASRSTTTTTTCYPTGNGSQSCTTTTTVTYSLNSKEYSPGRAP